METINGISPMAGDEDPTNPTKTDCNYITSLTVKSRLRMAKRNIILAYAPRSIRTLFILNSPTCKDQGILMRRVYPFQICVRERDFFG